MDDDNEKQTEHEKCIAELHQRYHRYVLRQRWYKREPLDYQEWLEHTAVRLAEKLGEADETIELLEEKVESFARAAEINKDCWQEATRLSARLYGMLEAVKVAARRGDIVEVGRLVLHWECWN